MPITVITLMTTVMQYEYNVNEMHRQRLLYDIRHTQLCRGIGHPDLREDCTDTQYIKP